ncbi:SprT family zinc-dependent metalloprotease [Arenicella sp. 4NH20-0111]|uniref:M48 family metallopeptidase n=1 Tax=Arenicella sp. 4NH20-0111 TaxID=3127648 RepID=UPI003107C38B
MPNKHLKVDGLEVELVRSRRRTLGLELGPHGVKARAPLRMSEAAIVDFVKIKRKWIDKHMVGMPPPGDTSKVKLVDGAQLKLRGQTLNLQIEQGTRGRIKISHDCLVVPVAHSHLPLEQRVKNKLVRWYKDVSQQELQRRANYYAALMNVPKRRTDQIYVRDYKRRWGSCDSKGKLSFNWRILQAPTVVSDYVVVHELAHCHEFNHSKRFWTIVARQMPDYSDQENWLRTNGHQLYQF